MVYAIIHILTAFTIFVTFVGIYWTMDKWFLKAWNSDEETKPVRIPWLIWPLSGVIGTVMWLIIKSFHAGHLIGGRYAAELVLGQMLGQIMFGMLGSIIFRRIKTNAHLWILMLYILGMNSWCPLIGAAIMILLGFKPGPEAPIAM